MKNMESLQKIFMHTRHLLMIRPVMKKTRTIESYTTLLLLITLIGVLVLSPAILSSINTYTLVRSSGMIVANEAYAKSGSVEDIQAAVDAVVAAGGGTVYIPEGVFSFNASGNRRVNINIPAVGLKIFGAGINQTVLQMPVDDSAPDTIMFNVNGLSGGKIRISGITFKGRPNIDTSPTGDVGIKMAGCQDFRVDNCSFYYIGGQGVRVDDSLIQDGISGGDLSKVSQGVIDHCYFYDIYKPASHQAWRGFGYGVFVGRSWDYRWTIPNLYPDDPWTMFGQYYRNTYIENCCFEGCRHAVVGNWAGAYVLRYSTIKNHRFKETATTGHPVRQGVLGMLTCEIYNVTVINEGKYISTFWGFQVEGGSGLFYNNTISDLQNWFVISCCEYKNTDTFYHTGRTKEVYIWNNSISNCGDPWILDQSPTGCPPPVENEDYFFYAPSMDKNYIAYTYPHPLTLEESP